RIGPGHSEAVALAFPIGRTLPTQFSGSVASVHWSADALAEGAEVANTSFLQDARTPSVQVHLVNSGQRAARVAVTAVCWDGAGNSRGGGSRTVRVGRRAGRQLYVSRLCLCGCRRRPHRRHRADAVAVGYLGGLLSGWK